MFKEKVNGRTDAQRTTGHDISSLAKRWDCGKELILYQTIPCFQNAEDATF